MDAVDVLRAFFLFASCTILSVSLLDSLRSRFVPYGARATVTVESDSTPSKPSSSSPITHFLDHLASLKVPHSYFTQFYVVSLLSSIFWALQLMWFAHWLAGIAFYLAVSIALWIEGTGMQFP
ncbi:hypothetical protein APSETT444_010147 [Aspergillus pseudonomiae]